jgi:hypothetical protein
VVVVFVAVTSLSGCTLQPGSGQCEETIIEVQPLRFKASQKPVTLPARLTTKKGGRPVVGAELAFFNRTIPPWAPDRPTGRIVGTAVTGADGRAEFVDAAGVNGLVAVKDERLIGYIVRFQQITDVGGKFYCHSRATADITVEG